jgi:hypothetical protein
VRVIQLRRRRWQPPRASLYAAAHHNSGFQSSNIALTNVHSMAQNRTAISFGERNIGLQVGQSLAPISAEIHLPPGKPPARSSKPKPSSPGLTLDCTDVDRPETPPRPSSNVPFRRDPDFVDRPPLLDQLHQKCSAPAARIALVGLGGVG